MEIQRTKDILDIIATTFTIISMVFVGGLVVIKETARIRISAKAVAKAICKTHWLIIPVIVDLLAIISNLYWAAVFVGDDTPATRQFVVLAFVVAANMGVFAWRLRADLLSYLASLP